MEIVLSKHLDLGNEKVELALSDHVEEEAIESLHLIPTKNARFDVSFIDLPLSNEKLLPSILLAPILELKTLPDHLKYVFLGEEDTLPVIIAKELTPLQEKRLIGVLREHKTAIGWTIADIKGISLSMCMHRILLEEGSKPTKEAQHRLNPPVMEVVKKVILNLLDVGVINPISNSKWVSPV